MAPTSPVRNGRPAPLVPEEAARVRREACVASLTRAAISIGLAKLNKVLPGDIAKQWTDHRLDLVLRAAVSPTTTASAPALTQVAAALLETLVPMSAGADLLGRGVKL